VTSRVSVPRDEQEVDETDQLKRRDDIQDPVLGIHQALEPRAEQPV